MPFATFIEGPYAATYKDQAAGEVSGIRRWQRIMEAQPVRAGAFGPTVIDGVYRGGQCFCLMTFTEWAESTKDMLTPPPGGLLSDHADELVLTAVAGSSAAQTGPMVLTFGKAILSPSHNLIDYITEGEVPIVFRCFPYVADNGQVVWFEEGTF